MTATIVRNDTKAFADEEQHLRVPVVGRQRPPVRKDDRLTTTPILVVDRHAVFGGDGIAHAAAPIALLDRERAISAWLRGGAIERFIAKKMTPSGTGVARGSRVAPDGVRILKSISVLSLVQRPCQPLE